MHWHQLIFVIVCKESIAVVLDLLDDDRNVGMRIALGWDDNFTARNFASVERNDVDIWSHKITLIVNITEYHCKSLLITVWVFTLLRNILDSRCKVVGLGRSRSICRCLGARLNPLDTGSFRRRLSSCTFRIDSCSDPCRRAWCRSRK